MTGTLRALQEKVVNLSTDERAVLAELLLASLGQKSPAQRFWAQLASKRREDLVVGQVSMVPGSEALARIRSKLAWTTGIIQAQKLNFKKLLSSLPCKTAATRMNPRFFTDGGPPDPSEIVIGSIDF